MRAGIAIAALAILVTALSLQFTINFFDQDSADIPPDMQVQAGLGFLAAVAFLSRAFLAWAVISAAGNQTRPRIAWRLALFAVVTPFLLLAMDLAGNGLWFVANASGVSSFGGGMTRLGETLVLGYFAIAGPFDVAAWACLAAALALGLGRASAVSPDEDDEAGLGLELAPDPDL